MERAIVTRITRVRKFSCENSESIFSELGNLEVVTATSIKYANVFGFTQEEVFEVLYGFAFEGKKVLSGSMVFCQHKRLSQNPLDTF